MLANLQYYGHAFPTQKHTGVGKTKTQLDLKELVDTDAAVFY
jgi:hypothetical protein